MAHKYVLLFKEGNAQMRDLLGGKGANLAEMSNIGLPVPQGFTITTEACMKYYTDDMNINEGIVEQIYQALEKLEAETGKKFGGENNPLLVSVRSGSRASMPGMMDTILNLGLNDITVKVLEKATGNSRFAYDSYRRFIQMFSEVVKEIEKEKFDRIFDAAKKKNNVMSDTELSADDLKIIVEDFKKVYKEKIGQDFPQDPKTQLIESVKAVFKSWDNPRAIYYRRINDIPGDWGTAVNIQAMVFGNMGDDCGTGVAFTRNPSTGENKLYGEFMVNAQGEDVVAGIRTPEPIAALNDKNPAIFEEFMKYANILENHYKDMQDIEYTIENNILYLLQTRSGKRTAAAAVRIACELVDEGLLTKEEALLRIEPKQLDALLHPTFDTDAIKALTPIASGLPASPGAASGKIYFTASAAAKAAASVEGIKIILVRNETSPEDIEGMHASEGILTARGGMTSHAAVVARGMGTCCVAGCHDVNIDEDAKTMIVDGITYREGDNISLDGSTGNVYAGEVDTQESEISDEFARILAWADEIRSLGIRTNADSPADAKKALEFGASGIGLCRTEHMFFDADRILAVREMIVAKNREEREKALAKILPMQRQDFINLFEVMQDKPVTIRFLDPPLHEFLPHGEEEIKQLADKLNIEFDELDKTIDDLREINPMLGHRGCRLSITYPEIANMQTRAVIEAAITVRKEHGYNIIPEIMIPLVSEVKEFDYVKEHVDATAKLVFEEQGVEIAYLVGTMIEIPRAALTADEIAVDAEFFSFGTNDMSQMTFGFSRDDAGKFLADYYDKQIFESDPFARIDRKGVGELMKIACEKGRKTRPDIKLGVCGEHGGDPSSIEFCHIIGLDYVSCSPYRVPIARLAAAQAQINFKR